MGQKQKMRCVNDPRPLRERERESTVYRRPKIESWETNKIKIKALAGLITGCLPRRLHIRWIDIHRWMSIPEILQWGERYYLSYHITLLYTCAEEVFNLGNNKPGKAVWPSRFSSLANGATWFIWANFGRTNNKPTSFSMGPQNLIQATFSLRMVRSFLKINN